MEGLESKFLVFPYINILSLRTSSRNEREHALDELLLIAKSSEEESLITDTVVMDIIKKMIKQRNLTIETFKSANRLDLAEKEKIEADLLSVYLPKQLTESELKNIIIAIVKETAAESIRDMSKVMKVLKEKYGDKCDLQLASKIVKDKLSNNEI